MIPEGWEEVRLGDFARMRSGGTPHTSVPAYYGGDIPWASISDMSSSRKYLRVTERYLTEEGLNNSAAVLFPPRILLYAMYASIGECCISTCEVSTSQAILGIECGEGLNVEFLFYVMQSRRAEVVRSGQQGTQANLNAQMVREMCVALPGAAEQKAIAEALSDADTLVESLDALIAKKRDMRQAAMQRFMAPGSTLSGATMVRLGDVVQVRKGELITESTAIPGDVPVIAGGKDAAYHCARWNRDGLTVTVSASGANAGYVKLRKGRLWASDCSTISESPEYDVRYVAAQLEVRQSKLYQSQFGGAQPHVRPNDIAAIEVCWVDVAQQQRIGEMIEDVDAEIDALVAQREKAELLKQGMMQELLSGRVRLV